MGKQNFFDRVFPVKYNFFEMLENQAKLNSDGVEALFRWLSGRAEADADLLLKYVSDADSVRMKLESDLIEAFSTPFDRGDIYSISVTMDKIIEYAKSTYYSMKDFEVQPNDVIVNMVEKLKEGTNLFAQAVGELKRRPEKAEQLIPAMRESHNKVEEYYRDGMAVVFRSDDPMYALRQREVYHHIKDAAFNMEDSVDLLHRIIVRLT